MGAVKRTANWSKVAAHSYWDTLYTLLPVRPNPTNNGGMQNGSSVGTCTRCVHVFARLAPTCVLSRCLSTKFPRRRSVGSLSRVRCWLGVCAAKDAFCFDTFVFKCRYLISIKIHQSCTLFSLSLSLSPAVVLQFSCCKKKSATQLELQQKFCCCSLRETFVSVQEQQLERRKNNNKKKILPVLKFPTFFSHLPRSTVNFGREGGALIILPFQ